MAQFDGKAVLITGGASGIGLATAKRFYQQGARVAVAGRSQPSLEQAQQEIGSELITILADVSTPDAVRAMVAEAKAKLGKLDIVFVNAGIALMAPYDQIDESFYDRIFDVNVKGAFFTAQESAKVMQDGGSIIFNTSVNNQQGMAMSSIYAASKAAVRSFVRVLANELSARGIRVTAVSPGPVETPIYSKLGLDEESVNGFAQSIAEKIPLNRFGTSDEIARAVTFLASEDASFVQGEELAVDGGFAQV